MASTRIIKTNDFVVPAEIIEYLRTTNPILHATLESDLKTKLSEAQNMDIDLDKLTDSELRISVQVRKEKIKSLQHSIKLLRQAILNQNQNQN